MPDLYNPVSMELYNKYSEEFQQGEPIGKKYAPSTSDVDEPRPTSKATADEAGSATDGKMLQSAIVGALSQEIVKRLAEALTEKSQYVIQFPDQIKKLDEQLKFMQAFVDDAERQKGKLDTVKELSNKLQKLIYGADDLVTDCEIRADYQKMNEPCCNVISFSEMAFRYHTGKKLTQINKSIAGMHADLNTFGKFGNLSDGELSRQKHASRRSSEILDENEIVGLTKDVGEISKWILEQDEAEPLLRIGIVGMGGLGKTTLAKMIVRDGYLSNRFQRKIWISVSQAVDEENILKSMLEQLNSVDRDSSTSGSLSKRIKNLLAQGTYLIVFDDVWRGGDSWWEHVSLVLPKTKGHNNCVIITSRNKMEVQKMGVKDSRIHRQEFLTETESWDLFQKVLSSRRDEPMTTDDQLVVIGKKIVEKCHGLPLAIKTIGGLMSLEDPTIRKWEKIFENFHYKLKAAQEDDKSKDSPSVIASLRLSYDELSPQLKQCLLSLSIYPEDHEIDAERLVHWWAGEGFVRSRGNETVTESAFDCLSQLINRCLVEVSRRRDFDGSITSCKMHDIVREMAIDIAKEEDFSSYDNHGTNIADPSTRRLGVTKDTTFQALKGNTNLRALLVISTHFIAFNRKIELANVLSLRVLDLCNVSLDEERTSLKDFWNWITSQKRLAYLNLRNVENLILVPVTIGKLWGLQVLILGECMNLRNLPKSVTYLPKLTILDVDNCPLEFLPQGIHRLSNLQELYGFKIPDKEHPQGCRFKELKSLTRLMVLQFAISEESIIDDDELTVLKELEKLRVLSVNARECEGKILSRLDSLILPESIQELYLKNYFGDTTPEWISPKSLPKLQYLCIENSRVEGVSPVFWGDKKVTWNVRGLCLKLCQTLKLKLQDLEQLMPHLKHKEISQCHSLEGFPRDIMSSVSWSKKKPEKQDKSEDALPQEDQNEGKQGTEVLQVNEEV